MNGDDDGSWHDQPPVVLAAGVAGLLLLALLVWAVINTADKLVQSTHTHRVPCVVGHVVDVPDSIDVEHELHGAECPNQRRQSGHHRAPPSTPSEDGPDDDETTTSTTNPYPTTTPTNAGHI